MSFHRNDHIPECDAAQDEAEYLENLSAYEILARKHPELMHVEIVYMLTPPTGDGECPF